MLHRRIGLCFALIVLAALPVAATPAGDELPAWLKQAAATSAPGYDKKVPAVVLYREQNVTVAEDGRVTTTTNYAVRILTREGHKEAVARESYLTNAGKVREMKAWLIRATGEVKKYGKDQTADLAFVDNDVYNEVRVRVILAGGDVDGPGAVFGYQSISEERTVFTQERWPFQDELPTLVSRFTLTLPAGWRASGIIFNAPKIEPAVTGTTYTWELRNLPHIEEEPNAPSLANLAPRLAVSYYPAAGTPFAGRTFESWADVARYMSEIEAPQATVDEALTAKARALTAGAKTELEKIQAIGRYVQGIQYISIQTDIGRGGGYRPRPATEVFAKQYGDCKDKANLMRAMLKVVGVESYLVSIYSGDPSYVREEWPAPGQFNHCIIAVKVNAETEAATIVTHPQLGRLLIFDATDESTPVGDLPDHEQGSLALIDAKETTALLRMPVTPPDANRLERTTEVTLDATGAIRATVSDRSVGQAAVYWRRVFNGRSRPEFGKAVERWITQGTATGARLSKVEPVDDHAGGRFALDMEFVADRYAQSMMDRLLVFKPSVVARGYSVWLPEPTRKHPVVLEAETFSETVRVKLPEGFAVDEMPDGIKINSEFGAYAASYEIKEGHLVFTRKLVQLATTIPAEQYKAVREFYGRVRASEEAPVVLAKK